MSIELQIDINYSIVTPIRDSYFVHKIISYQIIIISRSHELPKGFYNLCDKRPWYNNRI